MVQFMFSKNQPTKLMSSFLDGLAVANGITRNIWVHTRITFVNYTRYIILLITFNFLLNVMYFIPFKGKRVNFDQMIPLFLVLFHE